MVVIGVVMTFVLAAIVTVAWWQNEVSLDNNDENAGS